MANTFETIQNTIGYTFGNPDLLGQAFIRRSYSEENGGQNNEILEFIGDKALDFVVIRKLMERFGRIAEGGLSEPKHFKADLNEGKFTEIKKNLVEKKALAGCMNDLGFHHQLLMGAGDILGNVQEQDSVKEDLFEAILGAVVLDSGWNMDTITGAVEKMIDFDAYFENKIRKDDTFEDGNYVGHFQTWYQRNVDPASTPDYRYSGTEGECICTLSFSLHDIALSARGEGTSRAKARMNCAKNAYETVMKIAPRPNPIKKAVGDPNPARAVAQLNELAQKKMIQKPDYTSSSRYDQDGLTVWTVTLKIDGIDKTFTVENQSKKEGEKICAFQMLEYLMNR